MDEVLRFLKDNSTFYLATTEGSTPKVRPFGFVMEYDGRLCFCTNNQKDVYRQLTANPEFEICVASNTGEWLRLKGRAVFITNRESKKAALDVMPSLRRMYARTTRSSRSSAQVKPRRPSTALTSLRGL